MPPPLSSRCVLIPLLLASDPEQGMLGLVSLLITKYARVMGMAVFPEWSQSQTLIAELAERLGNNLSDTSAQALLELKVEQPSAERLRELAEKANEGSLSREEFAQYETYAQLRGLVALLQSKARLLQARSK